jgi:hypothetical protein
MLWCDPDSASPAAVVLFFCLLEDALKRNPFLKPPLAVETAPPTEATFSLGEVSE